VTKEKLKTVLKVHNAHNHYCSSVLERYCYGLGPTPLRTCAFERLAKKSRKNLTEIQFYLRGSEAGPHQCNPPHFTPCAARCHQDPAAAARAHGGRRRRRREEEAQRVYGWRGGAASFRRADTAKVCSNVGLVVIDGVSECSEAFAATQGVSGRLRARQGLRHLPLAATSAFDATSKRHVSTKPP
jgi:hypothetical protein